jgi:hypothetical protein
MELFTLVKLLGFFLLLGVGIQFVLWLRSAAKIRGTCSNNFLVIQGARRLLNLLRSGSPTFSQSVMLKAIVHFYEEADIVSNNAMFGATEFVSASFVLSRSRSQLLTTADVFIFFFRI